MVHQYLINKKFNIFINYFIGVARAKRMVGQIKGGGCGRGEVKGRGGKGGGRGQMGQMPHLALCTQHATPTPMIDRIENFTELDPILFFLIPKF